ncbi:MAG: hypothetical protein ACON47_04710 [Flavobacteriaceae bacterium]
MKKIIAVFALLAFAINCQNPDTKPRAVGFTNWTNDGTAYQFHLGTEASLSVLKSFDQASQNKDYPAIREIFSDSAKITYHNGQTANREDFISMNIRRDSMLAADGATLDWKLQTAYSVDLDPSKGGEIVDALYLASYTAKDEAYQFYASLKMYIRDGKIITVNQYNQSVVSEN